MSNRTIAPPRPFLNAQTINRIADRIETSTRAPIHPFYLPIGVLNLVHAIRVSHATRQVAGGHRSKLSVYQGFLLNQLLMFSGVILSGFLLGIPSPFLLAWPVVALYGGTHVVLELTGLGSILLQLNDDYSTGLAMDLVFATLDGVMRSEGIIDLGVEAVRKHPSPAVATSIFAIVVNALLIGGAVPLLIDLFKLDSETGEWGVRSPKWIRDPFAGTNDLWSSAFTAFCYLAMMDSKSMPALNDMFSTHGLTVADGLNSRQVRTVCAILLGLYMTTERLLRVPSKLRKLDMMKVADQTAPAEKILDQNVPRSPQSQKT